MRKNTLHASSYISGYFYIFIMVCSCSVHFFLHNSVIFIGLSQSIPGHVFWVWKGETYTKGDIVAWTSPPQHPTLKGRTIIKYVGGLQGDHVMQSDEHVRVNQRDCYRLYACKKPLDSVVIPEGMIFVYGTHPYSIDSRYACVGLIPHGWVIGRVFCVF